MAFAPGLLARLAREASDFDRHFGTRTGWAQPRASRLIPNGGTRYGPGRTDSLFEALDALLPDPAGWTFIDYGSGLGRLVLLAAAAGFRSSIGIEAQAALHRRALCNHADCLRHRQDLSSCRFVHADVRDFDAPAVALFCYAFNPFGEDVWKAVLADWRRARRAGGRQVLVYANPLHRGLIDGDPDAKLAATGKDWKAWTFR